MSSRSGGIRAGMVCAILLFAASPVALGDIFDDAVAYWSFDGTGSTILDSSLTTAVDLTMNSGDPTRVAGVVGSALEIDNTHTYFATSGADVDALDLGRDEAFTAASWINPNSKTPVMSKMSGSGENYRGWWLLVEFGGRVEFLLRSTNSPAEYLWMVAQEPGEDGTLQNVSLPSNEWRHLAVTFDYDAADPSRGVKFYVNGAEKIATPRNEYAQGLAQEPAPPTDSLASFNIGARDDTTASNFNGGKYDEMAVWKRALAPTEIQELVSAALPPNWPPSNYITNGDFEDTTGWDLPGTTGTPAGWTPNSQNPASQTGFLGPIGGAGTSAYMEPFATTDPALKREMRQSYLLPTSPDWQCDLDFAVEDPDDTTGRSLAMALRSFGGTQIALRVTDVDDDGMGELQVNAGSEGGGWTTIEGMEDVIAFDEDLTNDPLAHHLKITGHFNRGIPVYDILLTTADSTEYLASDVSLFDRGLPTVGYGLSSVAFYTYLSTGAYVLDNVSLVDLPPESRIPGDANRDGNVDEVDARALATNWGIAANATWDMGDFNGDGAVNMLDASILAANWAPATSETASVPEPGTVGLLALLLSTCIFRRRRR